MNEAERRFSEAAAKKNGWVRAPEGPFLDAVLVGLAANRERYGYYLCPCREGWGDRGKDADIVCPCRYAAADVREEGHCYCGLFLSRKFAASGAEVGPIQDRRPDELYP